MNKKQVILASPLVSLIWFVATVLLGGMTYPEYSHASQFISEMGATGSPHGDLVNFMGFVPTEVFIIIFVIAVFSALPKTKLMLLGTSCITIYALSLIVAAFFPCDFQCRPSDPSLTHNLHMLFGMAAYLFGILGLVFLALDSRNWSGAKFVGISGGCLAISAMILLLNFDPDSSVVGLIQRATELCLYLWFVILALYLYKHIPIQEKAR